MKRDLFAKGSLEKNGVQIIRDGFAVAKFGLNLTGEAISEASEPIRFEAGEGENGGLNPEEFLAKPFRILSQVVTPSRYFDFTKEGVLKSATPLFEGLTVYANHRSDVNDWKGFTQAAAWDGKNNPAGINALMVIDRTVDARLARGVEIGALKSASVTIWFEYEKSHPDLRYYYDHIGTQVDGELVRFVVTNITRAAEVSIVWEGEDPYAKALSAGEPEETEQPKGPKGEGDMKLSEAFLKSLGIEATAELTADLLESKVTAKLTSLETKVVELEADARVGREHLTDTRDRAATLYKTLKGDAARENYIDNVIQKADLETAKALVDEYQDQVEQSVPLSCPKCGEKLSRRSSKGEGETLQKSDKRIADFKVGRQE